MRGRDEERAEALKRLRRNLAASWPATPSKETALKVLDEMVWELHQSTASER
jgi:hypothetical protein